MWAFGTAVQPKRPPCRCLIALPGIICPQTPQFFLIIDRSEWPHWKLWGYSFVAVDLEDESAWDLWTAQYPDG
jgi:hypothetical protein